MTLFQRIHYNSIRKYSSVGKICYFCGSKKRIVRHHFDYDNLSAADRFVFLCTKCHLQMHKGRYDFCDIINGRVEFPPISIADSVRKFKIYKTKDRVKMLLHLIKISGMHPIWKIELLACREYLKKVKA